MISKGLGYFFLIFVFSGSLFAQAPYSNIDCGSAIQICSGQTYQYTAWTGTNYAQTGPYYGCLTSQPDPAWFYFLAGNTGDINIYMSSIPNKDIDFICWGPFDSPDAGCNGGLTQEKVIDCSYSSAWYENCIIPSMVSGKYYILLITNFSKQACSITFSQASGSGIMQCIQPPVVTNTGPVCEGQIAVLNCSSVPGGSYQWTGPNGFSSTVQNPIINNATGLNSGTYSVIVSVGSIILNPVSTILILNPLPVPQIIQPSSLCLGTNLSIGGTQNPGYTYQWNSVPPGFTSGLSNPVISPLVNTSYYLTVTSDQGCSNTASTSITVNPVPTVFVFPSSEVCQGTLVPLGSNPNPNYSYSWASEPPGFTSILSNPVVSPLVTTTYILTVTNQYSCSTIYSTTITVSPAPDAITGPPLSICLGTSVVLGTTAVIGNTYSWTSNPQGFTSTQSNPLITPQATTTYTLVETNTSSGCTASNNVTITVNPLPSAYTGPNTSLCLGNSLILGTTAVPGNLYSWTSNPPGFVSALSDPTVTPLSTTVYTLTETAPGNCSTTHSVTVTVTPLPNAVAGNPVAICEGNSAPIGGNSVIGNTYLWNSAPPGFTSTLSNPTVQPLQTTMYLLTVTNTATGCIATNSVTVTVNPLPVPGIIPNASLCLGTNLSIGAPAVTGNTYSWTSSPSGFVSNLSNPSVNPSQTTTYYLTQTVIATGCSKNASVTITVNPLPAANAGQDQSICSGSPVSIGGIPIPGHSYSWISDPPGFFSQSSNPIVYPVVTTTYILTETITSTACAKNNQVTITVKPTPVVTLQPFLPVCKNAAVFPLTGGNPAGGTYSGQGVSNGYFNPALVQPGYYNIVYTYANSQGCVGTAFQPIQVINKARIYGNFRYLNASNTIIDSCRAKLSDQSGILLDSVTVFNGNYSFNCLDNNNYQLRASSQKHWGGGNALDAMLVARYAVGLISFDNVQKKVADVNGTGTINVIDAYIIMRRWAGIINSFVSGDWYFNRYDTLVVNNQDVSAYFQGNCYGDVDHSFLMSPIPSPQQIMLCIHYPCMQNNMITEKICPLTFSITGPFLSEYSVVIQDINNEIDYQVFKNISANKEQHIYITDKIIHQQSISCKIQNTDNKTIITRILDIR